MKNSLRILALLFISFKVSAITHQVKINISDEAKTVLNKISLELQSKPTEVTFACEAKKDCFIQISPALDTTLIAQRIPHPFTEEFMVMRIFQGTQETQKSIYESLESLTETKPFKETQMERRLILDNKDIKFRCVQSIEENPQYGCWLLFKASIFE